MPFLEPDPGIKLTKLSAWQGYHRPAYRLADDLQSLMWFFIGKLNGPANAGRTALSCRRYSARPRFVPLTNSVETLEQRIVFNAAPYVMEATTVGTMSIYGFDYGLDPMETARVLFDVVAPHAQTISNLKQVVPGVPYNADGGFDIPLSPDGGFSDDASASVSIAGYMYHTDDELPIGQPETATLLLSGEASASAVITYSLDADGKVQFSDFLILASNFGKSVSEIARAN